MKSVGYCHSEERSDVGIRSLRLVDENNGLPRRPIGPPRNDKALQSVPIQNLRKIPVFFKYRHNKQDCTVQRYILPWDGRFLKGDMTLNIMILKNWILF